MNTTILACSAGSPELLLFPVIVGAVFILPLIAAGLIGVFNLGKVIEEKGKREASGGPPPLPGHDC